MMTFEQFLSKRVPTNFFVGKNQKVIMNISFPGDMIFEEDQIVIEQVKIDNIDENKDIVKKYLEETVKFPFDGVLIIKTENVEEYECRFFIKNKEETEYSKLFKDFEKLNSDFRIKKSDIEFVSGDMNCAEMISSLRTAITEKIRKAEEKRKRKSERK